MNEPDSDFKVDQKKLEAFCVKAYADAQRLFPGEDGNSLVAIGIHDMTKLDCNPSIPVPHMHLLETDAEWIDAIQSLSINASSAAERLAKYVGVYKHNKDMEDGKRQLGRQLCDLFLQLGVKGEVSFSKFSPAPPNKSRCWVVDSSERMEVTNFYYASRQSVVEYVDHEILKMRMEKKAKEFLVHLSPNSNMLRVYRLTGRKAKKS